MPVIAGHPGRWETAKRTPRYRYRKSGVYHECFTRVHGRPRCDEVLSWPVRGRRRCCCRPMPCRAESTAPCALSRPNAVAAQAAAISKTTGVKRAIGDVVDGGVQHLCSSQLQLHRRALTLVETEQSRGTGAHAGTALSHLA